MGTRHAVDQNVNLKLHKAIGPEPKHMLSILLNHQEITVKDYTSLKDYSYTDKDYRIEYSILF